MARFYANENFPRRTVEALRALGHDVLTTQEAGNAGQEISDDEVLAFATRAGRSVLTLNRRALAAGRLDIPRTIARQLEPLGLAACSFDELGHDVRAIHQRLLDIVASA
jgi:hypothetical protein